MYLGVSCPLHSCLLPYDADTKFGVTAESVALSAQHYATIEGLSTLNIDMSRRQRATTSFEDVALGIFIRWLKID